MLNILTVKLTNLFLVSCTCTHCFDTGALDVLIRIIQEFTREFRTSPIGPK
jgi:hypothetical protein